MMLEVTSFGSLSILYENFGNNYDKRVIANYFGLDVTTFQSWLHSIVYIRNICAHHARLWNRTMRIIPSIPNSVANNWIRITTNPNPIDGFPTVLINNRLYYFLSIVIYFLNTINPKHTFKNRLFHLLKKYPLIDIKAMGFPNDWQTELLWNID